jgi:hypothetical protein
MFRTAVRPQQNAISTSGRLCKSWEFDYHRATFYIQETDTGYAVVEETLPRGGWQIVDPQRQRLILAEFEHARRQRRL